MLSLRRCSRAFSRCSGFCCCRSQALGTRASVIMAHGPSCSVAHGVLVPRLGIEPVSPALAGGLNHWTTRGVPLISAPRWDSHCALLHSAGWLPYISLLFSNWHPLSRWPGFLLHRENWNHQKRTLPDALHSPTGAWLHLWLLGLFPARMAHASASTWPLLLTPLAHSETWFQQLFFLSLSISFCFPVDGSLWQ